MTPTPQQIERSMSELVLEYGMVDVPTILFALRVLRMLVDEPGELRDKLLEQAGE